MSLISLLWRLLVFALALGMPAAAVGFAVAGPRGALIALGSLAIVLAGLSARAEAAILAIYRVRPQAPDGARRSLARVTARLGVRAPRIFSFSDPAPQALVARGPAGPGSILISEGLLGALSEDELRELLEAGVRRLRGPGIRFQTVCAWFAHGALELAPLPWVELLFGELRWHEELGAWGALRFVVVFAAARFFTRLAGGVSVDAPRALRRMPVAAGEVVNPGSRMLHFSDPWRSRGLLP